MIIESKNRKEQRKLARKKRKGHFHSSTKTYNLESDVKETTSDGDKKKEEYDRQSMKVQSDKRKKKRKRNNAIDGNSNNNEPIQELSYTVTTDHCSDTLEAIRRDDMEIAELEKKLGITGTSKKSKKKLKLNEEYAKLEGYGDDFGDFLDDLDSMMTRLKQPNVNNNFNEVDDKQKIDTGSSTHVEDSDDDKDEDTPIVTIKEKIKNAYQCDEEPLYKNFDPTLVDAIRRDDEEIYLLEKKLGLSKRKEKEKLYKEYSTLEGYGDDFGEFLDDLDDMMTRLKQPNNNDFNEDDDDEVNNNDDIGSIDDDNEEELLSMNDETDSGADDDLLQEEENVEVTQGENFSKLDSKKEDNGGEENVNSSDSNSTNDSDSDESSNKEEEAEPDHHVADTYQPIAGEDIYGNKIDSDSQKDLTLSKYVPPHLRKKSNDDEGENNTRKAILRSLNNCLNRLSEDTLISVSKQVSQLYSSNPTPLVHESIWKNAKAACIDSPMLMVGLIPLYAACVTGVHILTGDTIQTGEFVLENVVAELLDRLRSFRKNNLNTADRESREAESKQICNLMLFLGYLYNFNIVHCSFIYDIIRHLIEHFAEVEIECLLLLLSHCGKSLRSDDPMALKEIVLAVQKKRMKNIEQSLSSRMEYMVSAIMDLKNNRRKRDETSITETAGKFRKIVGRIKAYAAKSSVSKSSSEASLRISLDDIVNADTKGRWWKVGASWVGNQYRFTENPGKETTGSNEGSELRQQENTFASLCSEDGDEKLFKLASKLRMNTDRKRAIFCIIMGGTDCEDTFEKLCRSSMLQNRSERDTLRVLMECCGNEKSYNKFYGHLAARICEYQPQSKFSLQLAYWDFFKQLGDASARKCANLAKLLFHLVVTHQALKILPVIKTIDFADDEMDEATMIFLTILFSSMLEYFDDPSQLTATLTRRITESNEDEGTTAGLLVFFMETLKASPKNKKGSRFRKNFKAIVKELDTDGFEGMF